MKSFKEMANSCKHSIFLENQVENDHFVALFCTESTSTNITDFYCVLSSETFFHPFLYNISFSI